MFSKIPKLLTTAAKTLPPTYLNFLTVFLDYFVHYNQITSRIRLQTVYATDNGKLLLL